MLDSRPTYLLLPEFDTPPPPTGPLNVGTIISNVRDPSTSTLCTIPPPDHDIKTVRQEQVVTQDSLQGMPQLDFSEIRTTYFEPDQAYLQTALKKPALKDYFKSSADPVYLITGLKVVNGVKLKSSNSKGETRRKANKDPLGSGIPEVPSEFLFAIKVRTLRLSSVTTYHQQAHEYGLWEGDVELPISHGISGHEILGIPSRMGIDDSVENVVVKLSVKRRGCLTCFSGGSSREVDEYEEAKRQRRELRRALEKYAIDD